MHRYNLEKFWLQYFLNYNMVFNKELVYRVELISSQQPVMLRMSTTAFCTSCSYFRADSFMSRLIMLVLSKQDATLASYHLPRLGHGVLASCRVVVVE